MPKAQQPAERAPKSLYREENTTFLATLRGLRLQANLTQVALAERLGRSQNFVTAVERGVVRLDGLQLRDWCIACETDLVAWAIQIERALSERSKPKRKRAQ